MAESKNIRIDRNNTDFPLKLTQVLKELISSEKNNDNDMSFLKYHQNLVRYFAAKVDVYSSIPGRRDISNSRGLLVYHQMGTGKTLQAIAIAMEFIEMNQTAKIGRGLNRDIIVVLAKSLRENFLLSITKYIQLRGKLNPSYFLFNLGEEDRAEWIKKNFHFVTLLASNMIKQIGDIAQKKSEIDVDLAAEEDEKFQKIVDSGSLDGKVLIIDEAQNLFRAITNGSKGAVALYNLIMAADDLKLFLLSGTPISNNPFETVACFNMIAGREVLPENYGDFKKYFIDPAKNIINHKNVFQNRITGLVSYVAAGINDKGGKLDEKLAFPEEKEMKVLYTPMTRRQYSYYVYARDKEKAEGTYQYGRSSSSAAMTKPKSNKSSTYRQRSRQVGNYCPPDKLALMKYSEINIDSIEAAETSSPKFEKIYSLMTGEHRNQLCIGYSQFAGAGGLATLIKFLISNKGCKLHRLLKGIGNIGNLLKKDDIIDNDENKAELRNTEDKTASSHSLAEVKIGGDDNKNDDKNIKKVSFIFEKEGEFGDNNMEKYVENEMLAAVKSYSEKGKITSIFKEVTSAEVTKNGKKMSKITAKMTIEFDESNQSNQNIKNIENKNGEIMISAGGEESLKSAESDSGRSITIAIISGEVPVDIRSKIIEEFNSPDNKTGNKIGLLLITRTGAEGLDLKRVRAIFILEPPWTYSLISQIKARGVRSGSHADMPEADRNVQTYIFIATKPDTDPAEETLRKAIIGDKLISNLDENLFAAENESGSKIVAAAASNAAGVEELLTTDMHLYYEALRDRAMIDSFLDAIKESSIECEILGHVKELGLTCRQCTPTNVPLFTDNIARDCVSPDPCSLLKETSVKARPIEYAGRQLFYIPDLKSLYGYSFFEHSAKLGKYISADVANIINELIEIINNKK